MILKKKGVEDPTKKEIDIIIKASNNIERPEKNGRGH